MIRRELLTNLISRSAHHRSLHLVNQVIEVFLDCLVVTFAGESFVDEFLVCLPQFFSYVC